VEDRKTQMQRDTGSVFVSYARHDRADAAAFCAYLSKLALDAWTDIQKPDPFQYFGHDWVESDRQPLRNLLQPPGQAGTSKPHLILRLVRRLFATDHIDPSEDSHGRPYQDLNESGYLVILLTPSDGRVCEVPWELMREGLQKREGLTPLISETTAEDLLRQSLESLKSLADVVSREQASRVFYEAIALMCTASKDDDALQARLQSALHEKREQDIVRDIRENPAFWLDKRVTHFAEAGRETTDLAGCDLARVLMPQGVFLGNRLLTYPSERYARHSSGIETIGGLLKAVRKAWQVIQLSWGDPKAIRILHDCVERDSFGLSTTLLRALRIGLREDRGADVPACLIETPGRMTVYVDQGLAWRRKSFAVLHELAHVLLNHKDASPYILQGDEANLLAHGEQEAEADAFADILLHLLDGISEIVDSLTSNGKEEPSKDAEPVSITRRSRFVTVSQEETVTSDALAKVGSLAVAGNCAPLLL